MQTEVSTSVCLVSCKGKQLEWVFGGRSWLLSGRWGCFVFVFLVDGGLGFFCVFCLLLSLWCFSRKADFLLT